MAVPIFTLRILIRVFNLKFPLFLRLENYEFWPKLGLMPRRVFIGETTLNEANSHTYSFGG